MPEDIYLFIADQDFLLKQRNDWLNDLGDSSVYISRSYKKEILGRQEILAMIGGTCEIEPVDGTIMGWGNIYILSLKR